MVTLSNSFDEHTSTNHRVFLLGRHYGSFYVFVSDVPFTSGNLNDTINQSGVWSQHYTSYPNPSTLVAVGRSGRYVRIQLGDTNYLSLAEVKVFALASTEGISALGNPYLFTGRQFDYETDLYYYRARYYNPDIGRFLQTDPVGYQAGMNWYNYCGGNPLNYTDPSGEGILKWLYTGDWNASDEVYNATVQGFADWLIPPGPNVPEGNGIYCENWVMDSVIATTILWADAFGIIGEFGRSDVADANYLFNLANPYTKVGPNEVIGDQEGYWANVHYDFGYAMGLIGIDRESAELLMRTWEWTEPGIITGYGWFHEWSDFFQPYQSRDYFENGLERGGEFDIVHGLEGYDAGQYWRQHRDD
jgi:RHS repeat-associated protein